MSAVVECRRQIDLPRFGGRMNLRFVKVFFVSGRRVSRRGARRKICLKGKDWQRFMENKKKEDRQQQKPGCD
jgi:hypothetical protein